MKNYRSDVEGLRGIAVLLVVAFHARLPGFAGGFIGVDVFFVLSGYLITGLIVAEIESNGTLSLTNFYARRARRLLPACAFVVLVTVLAGAFVFSPIEQLKNAKTAIATAAYATNAWLMWGSADYFAPNTETNPLLHTWSLAVEEQFYFVWPLLVSFGLRGVRARRNCVLLVAGASVASLVGCVWLTREFQPAAFFFSPVRAWEFGAGAIASFIPATAVRARPVARRVLGVAGLAMIGIAAFTFSAEMKFPGALAILPVVGTVAVLVAGVADDRGLTGAILDAAPLQRLGVLSYSWYLWHWPVLVLASASMTGIPVWARIACALVSLAIAQATYVLIEKPIRGAPVLARRPGLSLQVAAAITASSLAIGALGYLYAARTASAPPYRQLNAAATDLPPTKKECLAAFRESTVRECEFGDADSPTTIVLFGDSHANQWVPALDLAAKQRKWRVVTMMKAACPAADAPIYATALKREYSECAAWRQAALHRIVELQPAAVVLGSSVGVVAGASSNSARAGALTYTEWEAANRQTMAVLDAAHIRTIVLRDTPRLGFDAPTCLARAVRGDAVDDQQCIRSRDAALDANVFRVETRAAEGMSGVTFIDMSDRFCDAVQCYAMRDGMVVFSDATHVTATFARSLSSELSRRIGL